MQDEENDLVSLNVLKQRVKESIHSFIKLTEKYLDELTLTSNDTVNHGSNSDYLTNLLSELVQVDSEIVSNLSKINHLISIHTEWQASISKLTLLKNAKDNVATILFETESKLQDLIFDVDYEYPWLEQSLASEDSVKDSLSSSYMSVNTIINYSHLIGGRTYAPLRYDQIPGLRLKYLPPAPQEDMMRNSLLYQEYPMTLLEAGVMDSRISTIETALSDKQPPPLLPPPQQQQQEVTKLPKYIMKPSLKMLHGDDSDDWLETELNPDLE